MLESARNYDPVRAGVENDLMLLRGPIEPVLTRLDPLLLNPPQLTAEEFENLVLFVRTGLLDRRAERQNLCALIPDSLPSGMCTPCTSRIVHKAESETQRPSAGVAFLCDRRDRCTWPAAPTPRSCWIVNIITGKASI